MPVLLGISMMVSARRFARFRGRFARTQHAIDPYAYALIVVTAIASLFLLRVGWGVLGVVASALVLGECFASGRLRSIAPRIRREVADGGWFLTEPTVVDGHAFAAGTRLVLARGAIVGGTLTEPMEIQGVRVVGAFEANEAGALSRYRPTEDVPLFGFKGQSIVAAADTEVRSNPLRCVVARPLSFTRVEVPVRARVELRDGSLFVTSDDVISVDGEELPLDAEVSLSRQWFSSEVQVDVPRRGYRESQKK